MFFTQIFSFQGAWGKREPSYYGKFYFIFACFSPFSAAGHHLKAAEKVG